MLKDYAVAGSLEEAEEYLNSGDGSFQIVAGGTDVISKRWNRQGQ